ncbi:uncharacterized protein LOC131036857 isoform X1 [Cryptomeria japonica]|uniref:uncharacterized protein LOC131036857 isoform X1 n=1 Tax=Cryptomeria japonica TaxID=3369 RepID=UPI0025AB7ED7|nr:uncharacterized protein LOC131036857 isoform X1 [Cryptomeria japonica]
MNWQGKRRKELDGVKGVMAVEKMVVVVEEVEASKTALVWALQNVVRSGDVITLLHVSPSSETTPGHKKMRNFNMKKSNQRLSRLKGFHLALSFKDLCDRVPDVKVDIVVTEGEEGPTILSLVKKIGASALILGLHNQSFFCRVFGRKVTSDYCIENADCRVLAVKHNKTAGKHYFKQDRMASEIQILQYSLTELAHYWSD